jgi:hypothetical protein
VNIDFKKNVKNNIEKYAINLYKNKNIKINICNTWSICSILNTFYTKTTNYIIKYFLHG